MWNPNRCPSELLRDRIDGWVLKPVDWDPHQQYPAILDIHGGPKPFMGKFTTMRCSIGLIRLFCDVLQSTGQ